MTLDACAELLRRGDADRFAAAMAAPAQHRARLLPLYAFNLEVARAPWVSKEPMIAEMRLQWWRDVVAEPQPRAHEVAGPFHTVIRQAALPLAVIDRLIAARLHDAWGEPFADMAAFDAYLNDTAGGLMWLASTACGGTDEVAARHLGWAQGVANYLRAVPELEARGRFPLPDGRPEALRKLAEHGLERLRQARTGKVAPAAALAAWQTARLLKLAARDPAAVAEGRLELSEFAKRGGLLWQAMTGRY
ncbi:squalene/phytoene synthase family protein [Fuscibacter oryzae]|uniref:Squalene/phytoene synthase family protein n=1 Tax=Fuscibacter oryzae TaxID=2803939 RepID=A0A8J7MRM2_9RHOB|nr:squalene/phytoene synthase family protein [Fuscibacter oryzae]MBL4927625.1 squalene/phytoene synthase family protein [Fuscibacter oryzae]